MAIQFEDDRHEYIEDDIEKIQLKTGMYISYVGERGALHLATEVLQNAIDECTNEKSPGKNILVTLDLLEDSLSVEDDGRGVPETDISLEILCTKLNAGSKFTREQGGATAGENGTGLTCVNALSSYFSWASYRDGKEHIISFSEGKKMQDKIHKTKKAHGCVIKFIPSRKYLGKSAKLTQEGITGWIENISHFIPKDCKIHLDIMKGFTKISSKTYKAQPVSDLLKKKIVGDTFSPLISLQNTTQIVEDFRGERKIHRDLSIEFCFQYTDTVEPWVDSFCNYVNTTSGGVHLNAVRDTLIKYFMKKATESMTNKEKEKYKVLKTDAEQGLNLVVNMFTTMQMQFVGQTKNEVSNDILYDPIKEMVIQVLDQYSETNKDVAASIAKTIKLNCRARVDASKIRAATTKENINRFKKHMMQNFTPCNNEGKAYKELHICEGASAAGSLIDGRDPDTQAFLSFRGLTASPFKNDLASIMENKEWKRYVDILKCGIGPSFDINKLYYDKIIIETDSDVDGYAITSGIGAFHAVFMPEIVLAGKLYKSVAPLYQLDDPKHEFVRSKREYVELYENKIIKNYDVILVDKGDKKALSKDDFKEFIYDTVDYASRLVSLAEYCRVNKFFVERLASYFLLHCENPDVEVLFKNNKFVVAFMEMIQKQFPEITLKMTNSVGLVGAIEGKSQSIKINNRFVKKSMKLQDVFQKYGYTIMVKGKKETKYTQMSIGKFLDMTSSYRPKIKSRYKGLGEADGPQLWETTLNPDTRILIQLTMTDVDRDLAIFRKLHGQSKTDLAARKAMMSAYQIRREDLDN